MAADCCGEKFDLFFQSHIHERGCPKRQVGSNREATEQRFEEGLKDAFRPSLSLDPSYKLSKKLEEERRGRAHS